MREELRQGDIAFRHASAALTLLHTLKNSPASTTNTAPVFSSPRAKERVLPLWK